MTKALPVPTIESALQALESAAGRVVQSARAEQTAPADQLPQIVATKLAALDDVNGAYAKLRDALTGTAYAGSLQRLADQAPSTDLRERARTALKAVSQAQAENEISRRLIQSKLNFTRTMNAAMQALHDESGLAGAPTSASPFPGIRSAAPRVSRRIGSA